MTSKFRYTAYMSLAFFVLIISSGLWHASIFKSFFTTIIGGKIIYVILGIAVVSSFTTVRTKLIKASFNDDTLTVRHFFGFGKRQLFYLNDITGYFTSRAPGRYMHHNYIYIMVGTRKVAKISSQYHSNFEELRIHIQRHLHYLGTVETNVITELIDLS
ncbi:hypothetical protein [Flavobacterium subsaxonicum]|uniref:Uncharacterized protein n=1 Tax=Flavobacterium subsaxonicum WB 4.1-42 = DSM 21790 TaxID=1121898 RepID=A0A0A2MJW8_9FLAO|nr:hypothetical protein [Flavobacterium subsaxonicum]KGO91886.1 hypothetical protein Q766_15710 [Flavobacterium subsaxonicum WB 4.1-42 = DSM 21790]